MGKKLGMWFEAREICGAEGGYVVCEGLRKGICLRERLYMLAVRTGEVFFPRETVM